MSYWKKYWEKAAQNESLFLQVQRNNNFNAESLKQIEDNICELINLRNEDSLLDVCCGNGLITKYLAARCRKIIGVDFSDQMINTANKQRLLPNIEFIKEDALYLNNSIKEKFDIIILYFSFQYFNRSQGEKAILEIKKLLKPKGKILIGDIPNKNKIWMFYDTPIKRFFYIKQMLLNQSKMGKFWSEKEMKEISKKLNLKGTYIEQPTNLPHSHYRFDYLFEQTNI